MCCQCHKRPRIWSSVGLHGSDCDWIIQFSKEYSKQFRSLYDITIRLKLVWSNYDITCFHDRINMITVPHVHYKERWFLSNIAPKFFDIIDEIMKCNICEVVHTYINVLIHIAEMCKVRGYTLVIMSKFVTAGLHTTFWSKWPSNIFITKLVKIKYVFKNVDFAKYLSCLNIRVTPTVSDGKLRGVVWMRFWDWFTVIELHWRFKVIIYSPKGIWAIHEVCISQRI